MQIGGGVGGGGGGYPSGVVWIRGIGGMKVD